MKDLLAWFNARAPREQQTMIAGTAVVVVLVVYGWIWLPLAADTARLRSGIVPLRTQAAQVAADSVEAKRLAAAPKAQVSGDLLAPMVEQSAFAAGMKDRVRVVSLDTARVQVSAEGVGFNEFVNLLATLQQSRNARVESARVEAAGVGSGLVKVQAVLVRPGK